jgi:hypothetical protein
MQEAVTENQISHNHSRDRCHDDAADGDDDVAVLSVNDGNFNNDNNYGRTNIDYPYSELDVVVDSTTSTAKTEIRQVMIDNRRTIYIPIRLQCGITIMCHTDLWNQPQQEQWFHHIRRILQMDVSYCLQIVPKSVQSLIRRTKIWLNCQNYYYYDYGDEDPQSAKQQPIYVNHTTTHHHVAWLLWYVGISSFFCLLSLSRSQ